MSKRQKLSYVQLQDLPDEVILKIFSYMDIREILKCGQVSKRIRAVSTDESLWSKLNFFGGYVPYEFLEKAVENGCRYLSLAFARLYHGKNSKMPLNLKYLEMSIEKHAFNQPGRLDVPKELLYNCHSLQKLAMASWTLNSEDIDHIGENGQTLKVLNLAEVRLWAVYTNPNNFRKHKVKTTIAIQKLFERCVELNELNFSNLWDYQTELFTAIVDNLNPKILKVDLSNNKFLKDIHVMTLVKRCTKITELNLSYTSITNNSVDSIAKHASLEKLDVSNTEIDSTALLQLGTIRTLKVLNCCLKDNKIDENNLRKRVPQLSINKEDLFYIATSYIVSNRKYVQWYKNGFWEIKAKQQELFTEKIQT